MGPPSMSDHPTHLPDSSAPEPYVPPRLAADLVRLAGSDSVRSELDRRILAAARAEVRARRTRRRILVISGPVAAAACIGLAAAVVWPRLNAGRSGTPFPPANTMNSAPGFAANASDAADINRDGDVNILDALVLARRVDGVDSVAGTDLTGDGRIDRADVDAIGARVVRLGSAAPRGGSGGGA